ncbi:BamA/TamA family outer membrane protein [Vibrio paucivorans]
MTRFTIAILSAALTLPAMAEEPQSWLDKMLIALGSSDEVDHSKAIDWGVLPGPFFNPEQGLGIGVAAVGLYTPYDWNPTTPYSTLTISSYGSTSGSYGLVANNRTYLNNDKVRLLVEGGLSHSPGYYWGVGRAQAEDESNKTEYDVQRFSLAPKVALEVLPETYLMAGWNYQHFSALDADPGAFTPNDLEQSQISGPTVALGYDSRDFEPNPRKGSYLSVEWSDFNQRYGGDYDFTQLTLNARQYWSLNSASIIAWDLYSQRAEGDIPWYGYSQLGDDKRMRGYYQGQYRDENQISTQVELRHSFNERHGMVAWVGAGNIAPEYNQLFDDTWLPTLGVGYRFAFKARINVRVDLGIGKDSAGFYFNINEAF